MTRAVVFETPGVLDLRAITCIGVNTKPNSVNPIGFFGTGLKYAVAVLVRCGIPLTVVTDGEVYAFYRKTERFRDKDFDFVRMKRETLARTLRSRAQYTELSYTTEYGKKWELWQVFRELYSNTLDEGGTTWTVDSLDEIHYADGSTYIIVVSDEFAAEYDLRDKHFLPDGLRVQQQDERIQVLDRPSSHIYYRGMRVYDLDKPSAVTYNFLKDVELTEDRTAKNSFMLKHYVEKFLLADAPQAVTEKVVAAAKGTWEADLSYTHHSESPSAAFTEAVRVSPEPNITARTYVQQRQVVTATLDVLRQWPKPWRATDGSIYDAEDKEILRGVGGMGTLHLSYLVRLMEGDLSPWEQQDWAKDNATLLQTSDEYAPEYAEDVQF